MARKARTRRDAAWNPPSKGGDVTALFAMLVAVPLLLPLVDDSLTTAALYLGSGASVCLLAGLVPLLRRNLLQSRFERVVDALIFDAVILSLGAWFIALPGFSGGDPILTAVFMIDLAALAVAAVPTLAATARKDRRTGWWLVAVCTSACVGDAVVAQGGPATITAICWGAAGVALLAAAADRGNLQEEDAHAG